MKYPFLSKVIAMHDYKDIEFMHLVEPFEFNQEQFEESLDFLRKKYVSKEEVQTIEKGDFVTIRCSSELKKFQKESITLNVGKNLYSKELENQLIGLNQNDHQTLSVNETDVLVDVLKIERNVLPELSDEFIDKTFIELSTYEDLVNWYKNDQKENYLQYQSKSIAEKVSREVVLKSQFEMDLDEVNEARESGKSIVEEMWIFNGVPLDTMSHEQAMELLGFPSAQDYIEWFMDLNEQSLHESLLGYEALKERNQLPTLDQYEEILEKYSEEDGKTIEEMKNMFTYSTFMKQTCAQKYNEMISDYIYEKLKEKEL